MTTFAPPSDRDAEYRLVAACAVDASLLERVSALPAEDFYFHPARVAWAKMNADHAAGRVVIPADYAEFRVDFVTPLPEFVEADAARIQEMAYRRAALSQASAIAKSAYTGEAHDLQRAMLGAAEIPTHGAHSRIVAMPDLARVEFEKLAEGNFDGVTLPTGLRRWDESLGGGLEIGTLTIVMARPGMGKSSALRQVSDLVSEAGNVVAVFTKEESAAQWARLVACRRARVPWLKFKQRKTDEAEEQRVYDELIALNTRTTLFLDESTPQNTDEVYAACAEIKRRMGRLDLVIADHLRLFSDRADNQVHRLGAISWGLKQIARRLQTCVLCAAQLSRAVEGQDDKRPDLKDLRDSGEVEENADNVTALYRENYYDTGADLKIEFLNRKFRGGERNSRACFVFIPEIMSFEELQHGENSGNAQAPVRANGHRSRRERVDIDG